MPNPLTDEESLTWLHITDLHSGMGGQDWLWPTFKASFYEDLQVMQDTAGSIDTVIFSGDLTQMGTRKDFDRLDEILSEMWAVFGKLGAKPSLIAIPGNHDVKWLEKLTPAHQVLKEWWSFPDLHDELFADDKSPYRTAVEEQLREFSQWITRLDASSIPTLKAKTLGILPGDQSLALQKGKLKIGLVLLNSTWLQIDSGEYLGKLHVDARQLHKVTNGSPAAWCDKHDLNFLVTHHPVDWLHPDSLAFWDSDINPSQRFDAHFYGHMHAPASQSISAGGGSVRRSVQGASLFGLRTIEKKLDRLHGYSVGRARRTKSNIEVRIWPRILTSRQDGSKALGRDQKFNLRESDGSYQLIDRPLGDSNVSEAEEPPPQSTALQIPTKSEDILKKVRYHLPLLPAHLSVRRIEQQACLEALHARRCAWLVSDWGMGEDGFLSSVKQAKGHIASPTFRIDLSDFVNRDQLFENVKSKLGCSLDRFAEEVANVGASYLIFDDFPLSFADKEEASAEDDLQELIAIILEFCPQLNVIIKARRAPKRPVFSVIEVAALDVADLRTYVSDHEKGGPDRANTATVSALHRHTDGIPTRVDQALKHLQVVTLSELLSSNTDLMMTTPVGGRFHPALVRSLRELSESSDVNQRRVFSLLKALMIFPQGERLSRIKRFNLNAPFFLPHAEELLDQQLIEVTTLQRIESATPDTQARTLVVPRQTRECLREMMEADEFRELNQKAAELYFGDRWKSGLMKSKALYRFDHAECPIGDIQNAAAIILRLFTDAVEHDDHREVERSLGLAHSFAGALIEGDHFSGAVNFCEQIIPLISEESYSEHRARLLADHGRALRMVGEAQKACDTLLEVAEHPFPSATRQVVLVSLALCYQSLGNGDGAKEYAQLALSIDKHSKSALQAQSILIELDDDATRRQHRLAAHETKCRRQNANVVANNIAIRRAREASDKTEVKKILAPVMNLSNDNKDHYNQTRAIIELSQLSPTLGDKEMLQLMGAYYFLFNEHMPSLFDRCHDALWGGFESRGDANNLFSLFRYSSLNWRLRGREEFEKGYIQRAISKFGSALAIETSDRSPRELAYLKIRASAAGLLSAPSTQALPSSAEEEG